MSRYIDADKLICAIDGAESLDTERDYDEIARFVEEAETADVEEVTRCKDCIYWASTLPEKERAEAANNPFSDCVCDMWESDGFAPNDFCSHGSKRKEN